MTSRLAFAVAFASTLTTISGVSSGNLTAVSATIVWSTDVPADTRVEYGPTVSYGSQTALNTVAVTSHSQGLSGLAPSTLYHFRVHSRDAAGNLASSGDFSFTTAPDNVAPMTPGGLSASAVSASQINLSWAATVAGTYLVLLRIEASDDKEGDSNLSIAGAGSGVVHSGAVAGFPLPTLRSGRVGRQRAITNAYGRSPVVTLREPLEGKALAAGQSADFGWTELAGAEFYRLEIQTEDRAPILSAVMPRGTSVYHAPPWLAERMAGKAIRWRVVALNATGRILRSTNWRRGGLA